jgi:hypothetical protein
MDAALCCVLCAVCCGAHRLSRKKKRAGDEDEPDSKPTASSASTSSSSTSASSSASTASSTAAAVAALTAPLSYWVHASPYHIVAAYKPVVRFTDSAWGLMTAAGAGAVGGGADPGSLRHFVSIFINGSFIPRSVPVRLGSAVLCAVGGCDGVTQFCDVVM